VFSSIRPRTWTRREGGREKGGGRERRERRSGRAGSASGGVEKGRKGGREGGREGKRDWVSTYLHVGDLGRVEQRLSLGLGVEGGHHQHGVSHGHAAVGLGNVLGGGGGEGRKVREESREGGEE